MRHIVLAMLALTAAATPALAGDVAVSVAVGEPGFYGQINIGSFPQPPVVYAQPVVVAPPPPAYRVVEPIYLHVPPGHEKHWKKHCHEYDACGRPVYFVRDDWYNREYVAHYRHAEEHGGHEHGYEHEQRAEHDHGRHHGEDRDN
jgi:hypothetical protein